LKLFYTRSGPYQETTIKDKIVQLQDLIDQYAKLNQRIREQVLLSKAYDQEYQSTVEKNVTAKSLIQSLMSGMH
jgi:hypothetical protein